MEEGRRKQEEGSRKKSPGRTQTPRNRVFYARVPAVTKYSCKKTRFLNTRAIQLKKPGFLASVPAVTKYSCKKTRFLTTRAIQLKKPGFLRPCAGSNEVFL
jgi:hypothetical protein